MQGAAPQRNTQAECIGHCVRGQGGSSTITKEIGPGVALTRTGAGAYLLTWDENPGVFMGVLATLAAATPGNLAGHTVIFDTYDATTRTLPFVVYNASFAAHDLAANEYVHIEAKFARTSVLGA